MASEVAEDQGMEGCFTFRGVNLVVSVKVLWLRGEVDGFQMIAVDLTGLAGGLDVRSEAKRGLQDDF